MIIGGKNDHMRGVTKMIRIRKYKLSARGSRGLAITIPRVIADDLGVTVGDALSLYRGSMDGLQVLVLANSDKPEIGGQDGK